MPIAPFHGKASYYAHLPWSEVALVKPDHSCMIVNRDVFNDLFVELDGERAALKEDCIQYVIEDPDKSLFEYPDWYIEAVEDGYIYAEEGYNDYILYCEYGDIVMDPGGVVLRNFKGELTYMHRHEFDKYYEVIGE